MNNGTVGELNVKLGLDDSGLDSGIKGAEKKSQSFGKRLAGTFGKVGKAIGKAVVAGTLVAGIALAGFAVKALKTASDIEEVANVVDTTFGDMAGDINDFAETANTQFGLSELAAKQFASGIGAILTPTGLGSEAIAEMSESFAGLSGDIASFFNVASEEAFAALRSGIIGETEPLKRFGIVMSQANLNAFALAEGMEKTTQQMSQAELATLRYQFVMDATNKVQGDFDKTSESLANQQRIFQTNVENLATAFGEVLLPIATGALIEINQKIEDIFPNLVFLADSLGGLFSKETVDTEGAINEFDEFGDAFGRIKPGPEPEERFKSALSGIVEVMISTFTEAFPEVVNTIAQGIPGIITAVITGLLAIIPKLAGISIKIIKALADGLVEAIPALAENIPVIIATIVSSLTENIPVLLDAGIQIIMSLIEGIVAAIPTLIDSVRNLLLNVLGSIIEALPMLVEGGILLLMGLAQGIIEAIPSLITVIGRIIPKLIRTLGEQLPLVIEGAVMIVLALIEGIVSALPVLLEVMPNLISQLMTTLLDLLPLIVKGAVAIVVALVEGIEVAIPLLTEAIPKLIDVIVETIVDLLPIIIDAAVLIMETLVEALVDQDAIVLEAIVTIGLSIVTAIGKLLPDIIEAGAELILGLIQGFFSVDLDGALSSMGNAIVNAFKNIFEIESPSKLMQREIGVNVGEGLVPDERMIPALQRKMKAIAVSIAAGGASGVQGNGAGQDQALQQAIPQTQATTINQFIILAEDAVRQISQQEAEIITNMALTEVAGT